MSINLKQWKYRRSVFAGILLIVLYFFIFSFSAQDGEESGSLSLFISEQCVEFIDLLSGSEWTDIAKDSMSEYFEYPIRKLAHFSEYACMGILLYFLLRPFYKKNKYFCVSVLLWIFISAGLDEFHQLFVSGRYSSFADVLLDTTGGMFGYLICILIETRYIRKEAIKL